MSDNHLEHESARNIHATQNEHTPSEDSAPSQLDPSLTSSPSPTKNKRNKTLYWCIGGSAVVLLAVALLLIFLPATQPASQDLLPYTFEDVDHNYYLLNIDGTVEQFASGDLHDPTVSKTGDSIGYIDSDNTLYLQFAGESTFSKVADSVESIYVLSDSFVIYKANEAHKIEQSASPTVKDILLELSGYMILYGGYDFYEYEDLYDLYESFAEDFREEYPAQTVDDAKEFYFLKTDRFYGGWIPQFEEREYMVERYYYLDAQSKTPILIADSPDFSIREHFLSCESDGIPTHVFYLGEDGDLNLLVPGQAPRVIAHITMPLNGSTELLGSTQTGSMVVWSVTDYSIEPTTTSLYVADFTGTHLIDMVSDHLTFPICLPNTAGDQLVCFTSESEYIYILNEGGIINPVYKGSGSSIMLFNQEGLLDYEFETLDSLSELYYIGEIDDLIEDDIGTLYTFDENNNRQTVLQDITDNIDIVGNHLFYQKEPDGDLYVCELDSSGSLTSNHRIIPEVSTIIYPYQDGQGVYFRQTLDSDKNIEAISQYEFSESPIPLFDGQGVQFFSAMQNGGLICLTELYDIIPPTGEDDSSGTQAGTLYYYPNSNAEPISLGENVVKVFDRLDDPASHPSNASKIYFLKDCELFEQDGITNIKGTLCVFDGKTVSVIAENILR